MRVTDSEIVGLVPASALGPEDVAYLRLEGFDPDRQILERLVGGRGGGAVSDQTLASMTLDGFLEALASDAPTPGGGAVGAISSAPRRRR